MEIDNSNFEISKSKISHIEKDTIVSSKSVLHLTRKFENLLGILKDGFCANENNEIPIYDYSHKTMENILFTIGEESTVPENVKIPMVCFSDISRKAFSNQMNRYGYYGISLSKDWAISNHLSPVIYVKDETMTHILFGRINSAIGQLKALIENNKIGIIEISAISNIITNLSSLKEFIKTYNDEKSNFKYYDEREWRYTVNNYFEKGNSNTYLKVDFNEIQQIFVETAKQKKIIEEIIKIKNNNFDRDNIILSGKYKHRG